MEQSQAAKIALLQVLEKLPAEDRKKIENYWKSLGYSEPRVYELTASKMQALRGFSTVAAATEGADFYFRPELLDEAPLKVQQAIISHELAHSFNGPEQEKRVAYEILERKADVLLGTLPEKSEKRQKASLNRIEAAADEVATKRWGYDLEQARRWCAEHLGGTIE